MDNDIFDIYGDLEEFDTNEELKNAKKTIDDLRHQLNICSRNVTQLELDNKQLAKTNKTIFENYSSLLQTAKHEIQRKDNEIVALRREKEDICFRRFKPVRKSQLSQFIQTDVTIGLTDLLIVQRPGKKTEQTRAITSNIQDKIKSSSYSSRHRERPESNGGRSRSRIRYESSQEKQRHYEDRDYRNRDRDRRAARIRRESCRMSEERKYHERPIDDGQERRNKRDRYEGASSNQFRSKNLDVGKNQKYHEKDSIQPAFQDAREIIRMKRSRDSNSNDRESKKRRSKSMDTSKTLHEKMSKIFGEESSSENILETCEKSVIASDSFKYQFSNEQNESNHLEPTVTSTTVLLPEYAQSMVEIDLKTQEPPNELAIIPSFVELEKLQTEPPVTAFSTFEQATLPQDESQTPVVVLKRLKNKLIADSLGKMQEISPHKQTKQLAEPKLANSKVSASKNLKKILPKPNKADSDIESSVRAADLVEAIILDPRLLKTRYCTRKSEELTVITRFSSSAERTPPAYNIDTNTKELDSSMSLFPLANTRSAGSEPSNPNQMMEQGSKIYPMKERDMPVVASGFDTNLVQNKINKRICARVKSVCIDRFPDVKQQNEDVSISLAELKKGASTSRRITKRSLSMYHELPQPNKKSNYSENMSLIKSIIDEGKTTKYISAEEQDPLRKESDVKIESSKEKATTKLNELKPIKTLGRIPKIVKQTSNELKLEAKTGKKTKKDTIVYSEAQIDLNVQNTNKKSLKIQQTKQLSDHNIRNTAEVPADTKLPHKESVQECEVYNQDCGTPILFELLNVGTYSKHNQVASREIVESLNKTETTEPKPKQVTDSCSRTADVTEKKDTVQICTSNSTGFMKLHTGPPNSEDKSVNSDRSLQSLNESQQMLKTPPLAIGKGECISTTRHLTQNVDDMTEICDKTEESVVVSLIDARNRLTELAMEPQTSESINDKGVIQGPPVQPLQEITNGFVAAIHFQQKNEPVGQEINILLPKRVSKHRSSKLSEHKKVTLTTPPLDITSSSNSDMDIDIELERLHGMTSETQAPFGLPPCMDNGSLIVEVNQKLNVSTGAFDNQANEIANGTVEPKRSYKQPVELCFDPTSKTATAKNSDHVTETPREKTLEHDQNKKPLDTTFTNESMTPENNSKSDDGNESTQMSNDDSLNTNRVLKSVGRITYYVEQAQDGSNEETMYIVRKKKKKSKKKIV